MISRVSRSDPIRLTLASLAVIAVLILAYRPGLPASYYFDDLPNLAGLESTGDWSSARQFILSGIASPLGRPVALATFLIDGHHWPETPSGLRLTNVVIHGINAVLVGLLAFGLSRARRSSMAVCAWIGVVTAALWSLLPILASTAMMIIQRMTSLSALFVLLGLLAFLAFHQSDRLRPWTILTGLSFVVPALTLTATLSKENGALLPVYALVIAGFIGRPANLSVRQWRAWSGIFLWLPFAALLTYLLYRSSYAEATVLMREFTATERLLTQAGVLWTYLFNAFVPVSTSALGPFHDNYGVARSILDPWALLSVLAWIGLIVMAFIARRRWPVFSFATFWFLAGHLLESTVIPLDLYFEHRNYLPLIGPAFAIVWSAFHVPAQWRRFAAIALPTYVLLLAWTTWETTRQWGQPLVFAEEQYRHNRDSARAAGFLATHLLAIDHHESALSIIDQAIDSTQDGERLSLSKIQVACSLDVDARPDIEVSRIQALLARATPDRNLARGLYGVVEAALSNGCPPLAPSTLSSWIESLAGNRWAQAHPDSIFWLSRARAAVAAERNANAERMEHLKSALVARMDPSTLASLIDLMVMSGQDSRACEVLSDLWEQRSPNPLKRARLNSLLGEMSSKIEGSGHSDRKCNWRG